MLKYKIKKIIAIEKGKSKKLSGKTETMMLETGDSGGSNSLDGSETVETPTDELKSNDNDKTKISEETMKEIDKELDELDNEIDQAISDEVDAAALEDYMGEQAISALEQGPEDTDILSKETEKVDQILVDMNKTIQKYIDKLFSQTNKNNSQKTRKKHINLIAMTLAIFTKNALVMAKL